MFLLKKFSSCILCGLSTTRHQDLCKDCLAELPIIPHPCLRCAKTLPDANILCGDCLTTPPPFDVTHTVFAYTTPITHLILNLKFQESLVHAQVFGELLAEKIQKIDAKLPDIIIPVPLHAKRLRERGFNQALEIAKPVAKKLKIPLQKRVCTRTKSTQAQARLNAEERKKNLRGAFLLHQSVKDLHIAIVDDVVTTGHTVSELSQLLKKNGARRVEIWCIARATS